MFGKKKPLVNSTFGEMFYWNTAWDATSKISLTLWDKAYSITLRVVAEKEKDGISQIQENAYRNFKEKKFEARKNIEEAVEKYYSTSDKQVLISKFTPTELQFSTKGESALIADNADDEDWHDPPPGLAVIISPKVAIFTQEEYAGYVFGGSDYYVEKELYGDEIIDE
jgi:hypothetical protein